MDGRRATAVLSAAVAATMLAAPAPAVAQQFSEIQLADGAAPSGITAGPDGAVWFTETGAGRIGRVGADGKLSEFSLPGLRSDPRQIAGRDALFYTVHVGGRVGRIELDGTVREAGVQTCPAATCGLRWPNGIAVAEDGSPWFMVQRNFALVNTGPDAAYADLCSRDARLERGACTPVDSAFEPSGHTTGGPVLGPDGAMWFTNKYERFIGRIPATGPRTLTRFELPSRNDPEDITLGPDGALWWVEPETDEIGRITTGGVRTAFRLPRSGSRPSGITAGPDGAVWFTESGRSGNAIGRITSDGTIREFPLPTPDSGPGDIVTGPDGALWFTQARRNRIGRLVPGASSPAASASRSAATPSSSTTAGGAPDRPAARSGAATGSSPVGGATSSARAPGRLRPTAVVARRRGRSVAVRYRLAAPATVRVTLRRLAPRGRRVVRAVRPARPAGVNRMRLRAGRLAPGRYEVVVALTGRDGRRARASARFRVRR